MTWDRKKILIMDDEPNILNMYVRLFVEVGMIARWANNAQQALNIIIRERIDVVLLDINMPEIDGKVMFEAIEEYNPNLKVIVSSVYPVERQKELIPRAYDYCDKSEGLLVLLEKVVDAACDPVK